MNLEERVKSLVDQIPTIERIAEAEPRPGDAAHGWVAELKAVVRTHYGEHSQAFDEVVRQAMFFQGRTARVHQAWAVLKGIALSLYRDLGMVDPNVLLKSELRREGFFVDGRTFDALSRISDLIRAATSSIELVDNYISSDVLNLLSAKQAGVSVRIITRKLDGSTQSLAHAFKGQYGPLDIRSSGAFHDRFLIIDRKDYYHFGASIKDAGKRAFMFSRVEEPDVVSDIQSKWDAEWNNGSPLA